MFRPGLMRCNECEDSLPCPEPLEAALRAVGGGAEVARGNGPGARHQVCRWQESLQLRCPVPRQISQEPVEGVRTSSEAHECDARDRNLGASCGGGVGGAHVPALGAASSSSSGPRSSA